MRGSATSVGHAMECKNPSQGWDPHHVQRIFLRIGPPRGKYAAKNSPPQSRNFRMAGAALAGAPPAGRLPSQPDGGCTPHTTGSIHRIDFRTRLLFHWARLVHGQMRRYDHLRQRQLELRTLRQSLLVLGDLHGRFLRLRARIRVVHGTMREQRRFPQ
jgi:hypothetical protein